jgi:chromosome segregation ATPase
MTDEGGGWACPNCEALHSDLSAARHRNRDVLERISIAKTQVRSLESTLEERNATILSLKANAKKQKDYQAVCDLRDSLQKDYQTVCDLRDALQKDVLKLATENASHVLKIAEMQGKVEFLRAAVVELREERDIARNHLALLKSAALGQNIIQSELVDLRKQNDDLRHFNKLLMKDRIIASCKEEEKK